jgi:hypothetical protein
MSWALQKLFGTKKVTKKITEDEDEDDDKLWVVVDPYKTEGLGGQEFEIISKGEVKEAVNAFIVQCFTSTVSMEGKALNDRCLKSTISFHLLACPFPID